MTTDGSATLKKRESSDMTQIYFVMFHVPNATIISVSAGKEKESFVNDGKTFCKSFDNIISA